MGTQQDKNSSNKKTSEKGIISGFVDLDVSGRKAKGLYGRVTTMVTSHLYKPNELTLFSEKEEIDRDRAIAAKAEIFDFINKNTVFDNGIIRTLFSLSYLLTKDKADDILNFSKKSIKFKDIPQSDYVTRTLPIKDFVKFMYGSRGLHDRAIGEIKNIITLASVPVSWKYEIKDANGETQKWRKIAPFINYEIDIPDADGRDTANILEEIYKQGYMKISIGRPLLQNLEKRFALIPKALITEWGKNGTQNELFPILLNELLSLIGNYRDAAYKLIKRIKKENTHIDLNKDEDNLEINARIKGTLTCTILFSTLAQNSKYDYATKRRWDRMEEQVKANMNFFRDKIKIITEYQIIGRGSEKSVKFVFNLNYPTLKKLPNE